jgi:hypothetical protein
VKKKQKLKEYPVEEISQGRYYILIGQGWVAVERKVEIIKMTKMNPAGMTTVKFVKIK